MLNKLTPPLENGDRLTRIEFERRYAAMPDLKNAGSKKQCMMIKKLKAKS